MRIEQIADFLRGRFRQPRGLRLELAKLLQRGFDGLVKTDTLGCDLGLGDMALMDREIAAFDEIGGPDGDTRRHTQPGQSAFRGWRGAARHFFQLGRLVSPH